MTDQGRPTIRGLLTEWSGRSAFAVQAHYDAARLFARRHYWIGIPTVILASLVGTSIFAALEKDIDLPAKLFVASCSVLAAILSGLQTFLQYNEVSEKHRLAAARYSAIKREIEQLLTRPEEALANETAQIDQLRKKIDDLAMDVPRLPRAIYLATKRVQQGSIAS